MLWRTAYLAVCQAQAVPLPLAPVQAQDLPFTALCEQQADDVGLLPFLLARQEAGHRRAGITLHAPRRIGRDVAVCHGMVEDLPEYLQRPVGSA